MDYRVYDFATGLRSHITSDRVWAEAVRFFQADGFLMASHGYLPNTGNGYHPPQSTDKPTANTSQSPTFETPAPIRFESTKPAMDFFDHHGYQYDPILYKPSVGFNPYIAGPDFTTRDQFGDAYFAIMNEVRALGMNGGFVVPMVNYETGHIGRFAIGTPLTRRDLENLMRDRAETYRLIMLLADEHLRALPSQAEIDATGLSPREIECLSWLAQGDRVDRIAHRLGITSGTVNLHFANLKKKLRATTREQALVKAILYGLIKP